MTDNRLRRFCFTVNNWTLEHVSLLLTKVNYQYIIYGREIAPRTLTPHLQGYCELAERYAFSDLVHFLPGFHIEACKGTQRQNIDYCKKAGDFTEFGQPRVQGQRTDLSLLAEVCSQYSSVKEVVEKADVSATNFKIIAPLLQMYGPVRDWQPEVYWYWGRSGTGKTRTAFQELNTTSCFIKSPGTEKWFDGYDGHENVLLDDLRPDDLKFNFLLQLLDRYPCMVQTKGSVKQFLAKKIIITTPMKPKHYYEASTRFVGDSLDQLTRRLTLIKEFK